MPTPIWFVNTIKKLFPQRFLLARMTNLPFIGHIVDTALFNGDHIVYLPKDNIVHVNLSPDEIDEYILPSMVVEHFIQKAKHLWIMNFCICREGENCVDFSQDLGCLFLGNAVLNINSRFGRIVTREEALEHVQKCRDEGLVHMIGRNKLDSVWLGVGPSEELMTICNCCPCCCLWKMIPDVNPIISTKVNRMPGVDVEVNANCLGCGECMQGICFVNAITINNMRAEISDECRGCGRCIEICPNDAIDFNVNRQLFVQNTIDDLTPLVVIN